MKHLLLISLFMVAMASCKNVNPPKGINEEEVNGLTTFELQAQYLEKIGETNQLFRDEMIRAIQKYGYDSEERISAKEKMIVSNKMTLEKIEKYLETHGYPNLRDHGRIAVDIPWTVLQHSDNIKAMRRNYKYIHKAHSEDYQLRDIAITTYLNHMYKLEFGKQITWDRPFKVHEEIDTLIKTLKLEEIEN